MVLSTVLLAVTSPAALAGAPTPPSGLPAFALDAVPHRNDVTVCIDRDQIYPEFLRLIQGARRRIQVDYFLVSGEVGLTIAAALARQAAAGVDVRVVFDSKRGLGGPLSAGIAKVIDHLQAHHVPVRLYPIGLFGDPPNGLQRRIQIDHNKLLVIDGERAFIGSMNLHDRAMHNHDIMLRVQGPAAAELSRMLDAEWPLATPIPGAPVEPAKAAAWRPAVVPERGDTLLRLTQTAPQDRQGKTQLLALLNEAKTRIDLAMYLFAEPDLLQALVAAAKRGVPVRALLDPRLTSPAKYGRIATVLPNGMPNVAAAEALLAAGAQVHWFIPTRQDQESHMKLAIIDGRTVVAGSTNWTRNSFVRWRETGVVLSGPPVATLGAMFDRDWNRSQPCTALSWKERQVARLVRFLERHDWGFW